jgi:glycosyltransferase involved in cell wall biosynthesis
MSRPVVSSAPDRARVLHVDAERGFSGGEVQVFLLLEGLAQRGHAQALVCPPGSEAAREISARGLPVEVFGVSMGSDLSLPALRGLGRAMGAFKPDVAHLHTGRSTWLGGLAARRAGVPAISTRRMDRRVKRGLKNRLVYGPLLRRAVGIAPAVSRCLLDGGVGEHKVRTIWDAVDPARLRVSESRQATRTRLGAGPSDVVALVAAALVRRKGIDLLLEATAHVAELKLWIAGEGPEAEALSRRASEPDLAGRVHFLGQVSAMGDLYGGADLGVLPSRAEGLGVASLEAMAAGLPVVATRVGGLAEAVVDGETGLLVEPEDVDGLAAALRRLLEQAELRRRLGEGGRRRVEQVFLPERMVSAYVDVYREVLEEQR